MKAPGSGGDDAGPGVPREAFERRKAAIRAMPDAEERCRAAGDLVDESLAFRAEAALLRTEMTEQFKAAEGLTLQQVADRLGIGLSTVQKILEREKRAQRRRDRKRPAGN